MTAIELLTVINCLLLLAEVALFGIFVKLYTEILKVEHIKRLKGMP